MTDENAGARELPPKRTTYDAAWVGIPAGPTEKERELPPKQRNPLLDAYDTTYAAVLTPTERQREIQAAVLAERAEGDRRVAAERERCAEIAENAEVEATYPGRQLCSDIAEQIRSGQ